MSGDPRVYTAPPASGPIPPEANWESREWAGVPILDVDQFHPESSGHRPRVQARMQYDAEAVYGLFRVEDRYVRCVHTGYQSSVYEDACVEFFAKPKAGFGHFNFEMNACGALLCGYVEDATRLPGGDFVKSERIPEELGRVIQVHGSLSGPVQEERTEPVVWTVAFRIPFRVFEAYVGPLGALQGAAMDG